MTGSLATLRRYSRYNPFRLTAIGCPGGDRRGNKPDDSPDRLEGFKRQIWREKSPGNRGQSFGPKNRRGVELAVGGTLPGRRAASYNLNMARPTSVALLASILAATVAGSTRGQTIAQYDAGSGGSFVPDPGLRLGMVPAKHRADPGAPHQGTPIVNDLGDGAERLEYRRQQRVDGQSLLFAVHRRADGEWRVWRGTGERCRAANRLAVYDAGALPHGPQHQFREYGAEQFGCRISATSSNSI